MKHVKRTLVALLTFSLGFLATAAYSARLGRRIGYPRVFAWRNFLRRPPRIDPQTDSPLLITNPRYYSFMSLGSAIGGVLRFDVINRSGKPVHSYECRWYSSNQMGGGAYGAWAGPEETSLLPGRSTEGAISADKYFDLTLTIDFVQFADGSMWFSNARGATVRPEGVESGAKAAAEYLRQVLEREGAEAVMQRLPRIHAEVEEPRGSGVHSEFGRFGFYNGVTNMSVRVRHAYGEGGLKKVETFLQSSV